MIYLDCVIYVPVTAIQEIPLYMNVVLSILRDMGSDSFSYTSKSSFSFAPRALTHSVEFKRKINAIKFDRQQRAMITLRTDLLDSYVQDNAPDLTQWFGPGKLVIVDLTDPFVDGMCHTIEHHPRCH